MTFVFVVLAVFGVLVAAAIVLVLFLGISSLVKGRREATRIASQRLVDARNDTAAQR